MAQPQAELAALRHAADGDQPWQPWASDVTAEAEAEATSVATRVAGAELQLVALGRDIAAAEAALHAGAELEVCCDEKSCES